jgi:hypothetical protein
MRRVAFAVSSAGNSHAGYIGGVGSEPALYRHPVVYKVNQLRAYL